MATFSLAGCGGGLPADGVVQVGSNTITKQTFEHWLGVARTESGLARKVTKAERAEVIRFLIGADWLIGESEADHVKLSDTEVLRRLVAIRKAQYPTASDLRSLLKRTGMSASDLLLRVKLEMLGQRLQAKVVAKVAKPTAKQITVYFRAHRRTFSGHSLADERASISEQLLTLARERRVQRFASAFRARWRARTECRGGYVVEDCRSYRPPNPARG